MNEHIVIAKSGEEWDPAQVEGLAKVIQNSLMGLQDIGVSTLELSISVLSIGKNKNKKASIIILVSTYDADSSLCK